MKEPKKFYNLWLEFEPWENRVQIAPKVEEEKTDNDKLLNLQASYLQGNEKAFAELWQRFTLLCLKAVKKELGLRKVFMDSDEKQYKADIACEYVLRRYREYKVQKNDVYIINNFIAAAYHGAKHAIDAEGENDLFLSACQKASGKPVTSDKGEDLTTLLLT